MAAADLPTLPTALAELPSYISENKDTPIFELLQPYRQYEASIRSLYAQDPTNPVLKDSYANVLPIFKDGTSDIKTRARDVAAESEAEKAKYIMPLPDDKRRENGSPATVGSLAAFQKNFSIFSESSLVDLDWNNVVAAGSSVVNCLLPVPEEYNVNKGKLREYFHQKFCPASDVDLFLYGLTEEQAVEKIKQIETYIRGALLDEVTVIRTKYALTIASQYPVRHVQIVLRVYKSISEILTGFDVDAAGGAYDGRQVYVTPRALGSFITQVNHIDLTRRSPSYENRLSKYSHRGFEVHWPDLDRSRVDPTIFERSFQRTVGLARLLVLERLPTSSAREEYLNRRREERGRPQVHRNRHRLGGNIKDNYEDEIADWVAEEDVSNYHTFAVPYGQSFNARKIEKICYKRDLLLNAEWNQSSDRKVYLHRHPAFFGTVEDVVEDCCGSCPVPQTPEEIELARAESQHFISGKMSFIMDDPGRQQIGSFNPLTDNDWTDMAYVSDTAKLCQAIVKHDLNEVSAWLTQDDANPNDRDFTGRTPLHLAVMTSTPAIVKALIDHGARLTARLADGRTALHLAASCGNSEMVKIIMEKSIQNEEVEMERQARQHKAIQDEMTSKKQENEARDSHQVIEQASLTSDVSSDTGSDGELVTDDQSDTVAQSMVTGSFVKLENSKLEDDSVEMEERVDGPDFYNIDVLAWDVAYSPLHLAIVEGHEDTVKVLCDYGADSILPVKFKDTDSEGPVATLTITLAASLPAARAVSMARLLLQLGATSSQADGTGCTALHRVVKNGKFDVLELLCNSDQTGVKSAVNHFYCGRKYMTMCIAPLHTALDAKATASVYKLLEVGAKVVIDFDTWLKSARLSPRMNSRNLSLENNQRQYNESVEQPLISAIRMGDADIVAKFLEHGADPNTLILSSQNGVANGRTYSWSKDYAALDVVREELEKLREYSGESSGLEEPKLRSGLDEHLSQFSPGTYQHWMITRATKDIKDAYQRARKEYDHAAQAAAGVTGLEEKKKAIRNNIAQFERMEKELLRRGAKTFPELHPDVNYRGYSGRNVRDASEGKLPEISFSYDPDLTPTRTQAYIELMEAAWTGDLERIKARTLGVWGSAKDQSPLIMAIFDQEGNSPFSLAFLKGHHQVSQAILDIVKAQWTPQEKDALKYRLGTSADVAGDYGSDYDDDDDRSDDSEPRLTSEKVDQKFTIDDIGRVATQAKSHIKPLTVLSHVAMTMTVDKGEVVQDIMRQNLFTHALLTDDMKAMKTLLDLALRYSGRRLQGEGPDSVDRFYFPQDAFMWAIKNGKAQQLALAIRTTGAGIPLDHLVSASGGQIEQKSRYYPGLTVYGKKRREWARADHEQVSRPVGLQTAPLLHAALDGSLDSVQFLLSDAPQHLYSDFGKSKAGSDDHRLKHLQTSPGGFDDAIKRWLNAEGELVIHSACLAKPNPQSIALLEYLVKARPELMEKRNTAGDTPLLIACHMGRPDFVKILVSAGANQSLRNQRGENILHAALRGHPQLSKLRRFLDLLDTNLRTHLFLQRSNLSNGGRTPLHSWLVTVRNTCSREKDEFELSQSSVAILELLLECSQGRELDMLDGSGETCLHSLVRSGCLALVKVLVNSYPRLLYREDAVGRTPAEVAHDLVLEQRFDVPQRFEPAFSTYRYEPGAPQGILRKDPSDFGWERKARAVTADKLRSEARDLGLSGDYDAATLALFRSRAGLGEEPISETIKPSEHDARYLIWDLCSTAMKKNPGTRKLVSLHEANDVVKRLGEQYAPSRYLSAQHLRRGDFVFGKSHRADVDGSIKPACETKSDFVVEQLCNLQHKMAWDNDESEA